LITLHDDVLVLEIWDERGDWGLKGPNVAFSPFHEALEFVPVSEFRDGSNDAN
jgi:hypothetical protein